MHFISFIFEHQMRFFYVNAKQSLVETEPFARNLEKENTAIKNTFLRGTTESI